MTTYDIPHIVREAWTDSLIARNITAGFEKTGVFPFNRDLFTSVDFAPSSVTDRPAPRVVDATAVRGSHDVPKNYPIPTPADVRDL